MGIKKETIPLCSAATKTLVQITTSLGRFFKPLVPYYLSFFRNLKGRKRIFDAFLKRAEPIFHGLLREGATTGLHYVTQNVVVGFLGVKSPLLWQANTGKSLEDLIL